MHRAAVALQHAVHATLVDVDQLDVALLAADREERVARPRVGAPRERVEPLVLVLVAVLLHHGGRADVALPCVWILVAALEPPQFVLFSSSSLAAAAGASSAATSSPPPSSSSS